MAGIGEDVYFPPLEKCLRDKTVLLSWKDVYAALSSGNIPVCDGVQRFLCDNESLKILRRPLKPFDVASQGTKSQFDHTTAAINITPDESAPYDVKQIKEDAEWLSNSAGIDHVVALRIAVVEWQKRPALTLLTRSVDAERSIEDDQPGSDLNRSIFEAPAAKNEAVAGSASQKQRHSRMLVLYYSERAYILATARLLWTAQATASGLRAAKALGLSNLTQIHEVMAASFTPNQDASTFVTQAIASIKDALTSAEKDSELVQELSDDQSASSSILDLLILKLTSTLELITSTTESTWSLLTADSITSFFQLMLDTGYLSGLITTAGITNPTLATLLQLNVSVTSLAILKVPNTLHFASLDFNVRDGEDENQLRGYYVCNATCLKTLQDAFVVFAENNCDAAALAMFGYVIIADALQSFAQHSGALEDDDSEEDSAQYPLVTRDHWRTDRLNQSFLEISGGNASAGLGEAVALIAQSATAVLAVFNQMEAIMSMLNRYYDAPVLQSYAERVETILYDLHGAAQPLVQYSGETISALLAILGSERGYSHLQRRPSTECDPFADIVIKHIVEGKEYITHFGEMRTRYPLEMGPFHQFLRTLLLNGETSEERVQSLIELVTRAETFMIRLPAGFSGYREDPSNTDFGPDEVPYRLTTELPFFHSARASVGTLAITNGSFGSSEQDEDQYSETRLSADSLGSLVVSGRPPTILFTKHWSPLRYMLGALCTVIPGNEFICTSTGAPINTEDVTDILALLSTILLATHKAGIPMTSLLDETYLEAEPDRNLLEIVAEVFEAHLGAITSNAAAEDGGLDVLVAATNFFHAVALVAPTRLWPILARSKFLEIDGRGGSLVSIVTGIECVSGRYEFLKAAILLFEALVDASLWSGSASSGRETRALTRFSDRRALRVGGDSLPQRLAGTVVTSFTRTLLEVFVNSRAWRYANGRDRSEISAGLADAFDTILRYAYGFDDAADTHQKAVVSVLADAAQMIADVMGSTSSSHGPAAAIVDMLASGVALGEAPDVAVFGSSVVQEIKSAIQLCVTSIGVRVARSIPVSALEQALLKAAPLLVRLFAGMEVVKADAAGLMERLITATNSDGNGPSLLGNLSPKSARDFLVILGQLDMAYQNASTDREIWRMLSAVVSSKQQWFAISLLTGKIPKDRSQLKSKEKEAGSRTSSLFSHAINALSDTTLVDSRPNWNNLPTELVLEMLQFVANCQNHWSWAVSELRTHPKFIDAITKGYIRHLHREPTDTTASLANEAAVAAVIAEILAMYLFSSAQYGDAETAVKKVVDHLQYFEKFGVAAPKYSSSLHQQLEKTLGKQHPGLKLESFKHTLTFRTELGENYAYDVAFASKVLNTRRTKGARELRGLEKQIEAANEDLSFVEAQIRIVKGWKLLCLELVKHVSADLELAGLLIDVVKHCLEENTKAGTPTQGIWEMLRGHRVELALGLMQKLVTLDFKDKEQSRKLRELFGIAWDTIRTTGFDFENVFAASDVAYYRGLLQILFLTLKPLTKPDPDAKGTATAHTPKQANELLEVLVYIIIKGFKSLTSVLHANASLAQPSDFVLLTAMLQTMLKIPNIDLLSSQFALHFANNNTTSSATSLFSWADQFLIEGSDPTYGELAVLFLLEMSTIPQVAESMAVDGVLAQLASAKIMRLYSRPRGMGPFDNPPRLHSIWTRGILPLCLNLLDALGAVIAAEVVSFLNSFPTQLARLASELANRSSTVGTRPSDSHISLSLASEVHSLALIARVIDHWRLAGASAGVLANEIPVLEWDMNAIKEDVEDFVLGRSVLGALIVPVNEREAELARLMPLGAAIASSRLEERVMQEFVNARNCFADGV